MGTIKYSDEIDGNKGNYGWKVSFDLGDRYLGISQIEDGSVKDRVLLSPNQVKELVAFLEKNKRRR